MTSTNSSPSNSMKFRFKEIGPIKEAELELGDLTIIAGRNNTGKTYLVYTLYGFLQGWRAWQYREHQLMGKKIEEIAREVVNEGRATYKVDKNTLSRERKTVIGTLARSFSKDDLAEVFSSPRSAFKDASIEVELSGVFPRDVGALSTQRTTGETLSLQYDGESLSITRSKVEKHRHEYIDTLTYLAYLYIHFLLPELSIRPFVLSAERFGISLFYKELDFAKNRLVEMLQKLGNDKDEGLSFSFPLIDRASSRYALPIRDNIDYTRSIADLQKDRSELYEDKLFDNIKEMMDGYYRSESDEIKFRSKARKDRSFAIPLHLASSSARGLSDLYFFLRHVADKNHLLIVDEPESHLDTANQILLARLLARCVRVGLKVLITTHSDYLVKELSNLVMLSRPFAGKNDVVRKLKYREDDFLAPGSVRAYIAEDNTLRPCEVDTFGIDMPVFDETIDSINAVANELASRVAEEVEA